MLQSTRLEEQRTTLPRGGGGSGVGGGVGGGATSAASAGRIGSAEVNQMSAPTVPDEDFFSMISRLQVRPKSNVCLLVIAFLNRFNVSQSVMKRGQRCTQR